MKLLFLDDFRMPIECSMYMHRRIGNRNKLYHEKWDIVRSYIEFRDHILVCGLPDLISFDHDLGEDIAEEAREDGLSKRAARQLKKDVLNGYDCAKWLVNHCIDNSLELPGFVVHSMNPAGAENINGLLLNYLKQKA